MKSIVYYMDIVSWTSSIWTTQYLSLAHFTAWDNLNLII